MILQSYKTKKNMSEEDKKIEEWYAKWCEANGLYDHLTDRQIEEKYKKNYLLQ